MFAAFIQSSLAQVEATFLTEVFFWAIVMVLILSIIFAVLSRGWSFVNHAPTLLTSLGILGTFVGITAGLMNFDPANIDASIPLLLDGMKTAFLTSLAGMTAGIAFKAFLATPIAAPRQLQATAETSAADILQALLQQQQEIKTLRRAIAGDEDSSLVGQIKMLRLDQQEQQNKVVAAIGELRKTLAGTEETSLIGQVRLLRADEQDRYRQQQLDAQVFSNKLWQSLEAFAEMLSKSATEQMMNALKEVIADFNKNLTEQFGDNFKALDASVQKLVDWQAHYKEQLAEMIRQYAAGVSAIAATEASVKVIADSSSHIPDAMKQLKSLLLINLHQLQQLGNHLKAFSEMRDKAVAAVPEIREQIDLTVRTITACVQTANEHYTTLLDKSDAYIKAHDDKTTALLTAFTETTHQGIDLVRTELEAGADEVRQGLALGANQVQTAITESADGLNNTVQQTLTKTADQVTTALQTANEHYTTLLDKSDAYIKAHDDKTRKLLEQFGSTVIESIAQVKENLETGAKATHVALTGGAEALVHQVQQMDHTFSSANQLLADHQAQIRTQLEGQLKTIQQHIEMMTVTFTSEVQGISETLKSTGVQMQRDTQTVQQQVADSIQAMQKRLESALDAVFQQQATAIARAVEGLNEQMSKAVERTGEGVNKQLSAIDQAMMQEINRVMKEMANALAKITGKFTEDYSELVAKMAAVINLSNEIRR
ncbi:hypothetical protein [Thiospirillum jenense]|uniref:MotA/TolQ/ExbB proton channel domain-containing protein n=1 Tax=Thiospirillum jenense TaxID=1653858 RepID=A0A839HE34_9GAMM|nr:hypothetical protein [Thiospirillum jenense]MBB1125646.1 hypothetical protein [Thiospirillum jenense]